VEALQGEGVRIAVVHSFYGSQEPSGENVAVDAQVDQLASAGHVVRLVSRRTDDEQARPGYRARAGLTAASGWGPSPVAELAAFQPDIVHVHNLFPNYGDRWLTAWRGPVVHTLHNFRPLCANGMLARDGEVCTLCPEEGSHHAVKFKCYRSSRVASTPLALRTARGLDSYPQLTRSGALVVLSERSLALYQAFGLSHPNVAVIPNFAPASRGAASTAHERKPSFSYIGRLTEDKGIRQLVEAWPRTHELTIYGSGPLEEFVRRSQAPHLVFGGRLGRDDVAGVLRETAGLVFSSVGPENSPIVYLEALAAGAPVIAKSGNAVADDVAKGGHGIVFDQWGDLPVALRTAGEQSRDLQSRATARYDSTYSPGIWLRRMEDLYSSVLA
jgi:glycosyltransferase involved in cell wall biosynthesis